MNVGTQTVRFETPLVILAVVAALAALSCGGGSFGAPAPDYAAYPAEDTPTPYPRQAQIIEVEQVPAPATRLLTAGMVPDADRRSDYLDYLERHVQRAATFDLDLRQRLRVRVVDNRGEPVNDALVEVDLGGQERIEGRTRADGVYDAFPSMASVIAGSSQAQGGSLHVGIRVSTEWGHTERWLEVDLLVGGDWGQVEVVSNEVAEAPNVIDLGFAIDVTGSMEDELRYINAEIGDIVQRIEAHVPDTEVRVGATLYRDRGDEVPLEVIPFSTDVAGFAAALRSVSATGGGDYPEDLYAGLGTALDDLGWSEGNAVRVLCLIADAPPKDYSQRYTPAEMIGKLNYRGIRLLPIAASGADRDVEYLFRALGAATSTPYVYLTDDSGIGNPHLEPDTDRVTVELLNDLLTRLVIDDLLGRGMHAPDFVETEQRVSGLW